MKVCLILEGSYPYVHGGVSSWTQNFIKNQPDHEFVLWVIGAHERDRGNFVYELPSNIVEIHEVFLDSPLLHMADRRSRAITLPDTQANALGHLFMGDNPDWRTLIDLFQSGANSQDVLMSRVFFEMVTKLCREK